MEIKNVIAVLDGLSIRLRNYLIAREEEALQTAIPHLETLQKVKEAGGVKKREYVLEGIEPQDDRNYEPAWVEGWNDCLAAVHAELAGKLEGLEDVFAKMKGCKPDQEDCAFGKCRSWGECKILIKAIQELILNGNKK